MEVVADRIQFLNRGRGAAAGESHEMPAEEEAGTPSPSANSGSEEDIPF
jgi:hypothetical protein